MTHKVRVIEAVSCDKRTVERAASDMADIYRRRGYRGATSWALNSDTAARNSEGILSTAVLREHIAKRIYGERQAPLAGDREIAAELLEDHWREAMGATVAFEHGDSTLPVARPPVDRDWRPKRKRALEPHQEVWRQGPGWRIAATPPDE